jgi:hypothetical protein
VKYIVACCRPQPHNVCSPVFTFSTSHFNSLQKFIFQKTYIPQEKINSKCTCVVLLPQSPVSCLPAIHIPSTPSTNSFIHKAIGMWTLGWYGGQWTEQDALSHGSPLSPFFAVTLQYFITTPTHSTTNAHYLVCWHDDQEITTQITILLQMDRTKEITKFLHCR